MIRKDINSLDVKSFDLFHKDWALVTAGNYEERNTMTIAWGTLGTLWNKNVVIIFIRKERFTYHLLEKEERFTLSFMDNSYREQMSQMGNISGKDHDKYKVTGLVPIYDNDTFVSYIKGARMVMKCKKLYSFDLDKGNFIDKSILEKFYDTNNANDFHTAYVAEITSLLVDENEI